MSVMTGDVRSRAQIQDIVKHTVERHGGLDIMIANAGVSVPTIAPQWLPQKQDMIFQLHRTQGSQSCVSNGNEHT